MTRKRMNCFIYNFTISIETTNDISKHMIPKKLLRYLSSGTQMCRSIVLALVHHRARPISVLLIDVAEKSTIFPQY